ncbi:hypothetical protein TNCV_371981 [Trichonephila clavipes]|nr:hypothetical protein TNCV_371981 [Trichonephila clavipes]
MFFFVVCKTGRRSEKVDGGSKLRKETSASRMRAVVEAGSHSEHTHTQGYLLHPGRAKNGTVSGAALCNQVLCKTGKNGVETLERLTVMCVKLLRSHCIRVAGRIGCGNAFPAVNQSLSGPNGLLFASKVQKHPERNL